MSRTDKTDPYRVKEERHGGAFHWIREFGCGASCSTCGITRSERRRPRREGREATREWQRDYA